MKIDFEKGLFNMRGTSMYFSLWGLKKYLYNMRRTDMYNMYNNED